MADGVAIEGIPCVGKNGDAGVGKVDFPPIDYQALSYYSVPSKRLMRRRVWMRSIRSCWRPMRS